MKIKLQNYRTASRLIRLKSKMPYHDFVRLSIYLVFVMFFFFLEILIGYQCKFTVKNGKNLLVYSHILTF